ncbi:MULTISPECIES: SAM-dependent methyltransferase [Streptosporangium]|uniref:O-methyltransferase involved in polyketide biosynthesis n=1 Tax=Streptosporangium brasiliense TaxID=47480 RepID=A0ABT9R6B7_9ACTN|nr:SAM-dependent methyltransferase [Streptosporangium brasiliense]MDP9864789.1 O-methyltransferase involved in polyketide biosynthesis [Streptosporangium brasiliense]
MDDQATPDGVDPNVPNVARMYDYYLGGKDNFAADRAAAEQILKLFPATRDSARENRAFLSRAVRHLVGSGVRQIVDLGSGLPTQGNTHEIAHAVAPGTHVTYVDYDPVVCAHGRALLAGGDDVTILQADVRDPEKLLAELGGHVDFDRPVAFLMLALLHFIPDESAEGAGAHEIIRRLHGASAPGSYLVVSHAIDAKPDTTPEALEIYNQATAALNLRTHAEITRLFDGYELVEPGLVFPKDWRPADHPPLIGDQDTSIGYAGVGRKP